MKFTKEAWQKITPEERVWLVHYHKYCNKTSYSGGGYLPDDCSECPVCDQPVMGGGVCGSCLDEAGRLYQKMWS